jgi:hypothetical protein
MLLFGQEMRGGQRRNLGRRLKMTVMRSARDGPKRQLNRHAGVKTVIRTVLLVMVFVGLTLGVPVASNAAAEDPLLCDAAEMFQEARHMVALARCQRASTPDRILACEERSAVRFEKRMARLHERGICGGTNGPRLNPMQCEAKLMHAAGAHMDCEVRCERHASTAPEFDQDRCRASCDRRYENRVAAIRGRIGCEDFDVIR